MAAYAAAVTLVIVAAKLSRARGLYFAAWVVGVGWIARVLLYFAEQASGVYLEFAFPAIDGIAAALLLPKAMQPNYPGRLVFLTIAAIMLIQSMFQLFVMAHGDPEFIGGWLMLIENRLFEVILLLLLTVSILRIIRIRRPDWYAAIWREQDRDQEQRRVAAQS